MDKNIELKNGLYILFKNKNIIQRTEINDNTIKELSSLDYRIDIQNFCDCDLSDLDNEIGNLAVSIKFSEISETELRNIINRCYEIVDIIKSRNATLGALLTGTFENIVSNKKLLLEFEARRSLEDAALALSVRLYEVLHIQRKVKNFFPCIKHIDIIGKYINELVPKAVLCKTINMYENGIERTYLFFDYVKDYYEYLMFLFYNRKETVCECELCNRYFIPKTKKKTLYCDRVFKDGKTCKQIGPTQKYKTLAENDIVLKTFEKEKNKMYKRMERTSSFGETPKSISYDEYVDWLNKAINAKNMYLNNELTEIEALRIIQTD